MSKIKEILDRDFSSRLQESGNRVLGVLKNWPRYMMACTKSRYIGQRNQCDGCCAGIPLNNSNHVIR